MIKKLRLAVIPSDPLDAYKDAGYASWLEGYYNPLHCFNDVYLLSPLEKKERRELGMKVIPTQPRELKRRIRELGIHLVRGYGGYWACDMACNHRVDGVPVIVSVHDTNPKLLYNSVKRADVVFCTSNAVKRLVLTKFKHPEKAWILPNRIDLGIMRPYPKDALVDLDSKYPLKYKILHVGRKSVQKNLDTVIRAVKYLQPEYGLLAIGKGETEGYVQLAKREGVIDRCYFIQNIENRELARYYSFSDCMCTPSRWEGFGIVFIEALACEAIVITSDIAPMNEFIGHVENGLLVEDYENPKALANMIKLACEDKELRNSIKRKTRKSVERFEKNKIDELEASYYERILEMKGKGYFTIPLWKRETLLAENSVSEARAKFMRISRRLVPNSVKDKIRPFLKSEL
jgi:glycosyltransferase involved in cell wall biosynthesis